MKKFGKLLCLQTSTNWPFYVINHSAIFIFLNHYFTTCQLTEWVLATHRTNLIRIDLHENLAKEMLTPMSTPPPTMTPNFSGKSPHLKRAG